MAPATWLVPTAAALCQTSVDALDHDDGIVDEHAGAQRQPTQRDDVQALIGEPHQKQRREDRNRDGGRDDECGAGGTKEDGEHGHRQQYPQARGVLQIGERVDHQRGVVGHLGELHARQVVRQPYQRLPNRGRDLYGVGARLLEDGEPYPLDAVDANEMINLLVDHLNPPEVGDANRLAARLAVAEISHHHPLDVIGPAEARHSPHQEDLRALFEGARRDVDVLGHEPLLHVGERDAERLEPVPVQEYAHLLLPTTRDPDLRHPR